MVLFVCGCLPAAPPLKVTAADREVAATAPVTLMLAGDVMLARGVSRTLTFSSPEYIWGDVLPLLRGADVTVGNLECVLSNSGQPFEPRRVFYFRANPETAGPALVAAGIDLVSLANNHILDYGPDALRDTLGFLDHLGIRHAGAGLSFPQASAPVLLETRGIRVAFGAAADHFAEYAAGPEAPGIHLVSIDSEGKDMGRVRDVVRRVRGGADFVIYSLHWGPNLRRQPTDAFVRFAHALIDSGVDVVHGHSAHVFQGIEWYGGGVILYDTGDLMDDYIVDETVRNDQQFLFSVVLQEGRIVRVELFPFRIDRMQLRRVSGGEFEEMARRMAELSRPLGTVLVRKPDRVVSYAPEPGP